MTCFHGYQLATKSALALPARRVPRRRQYLHRTRRKTRSRGQVPIIHLSRPIRCLAYQCLNILKNSSKLRLCENSFECIWELSSVSNLDLISRQSCGEDLITSAQLCRFHQALRLKEHVTDGHRYYKIIKFYLKLDVKIESLRNGIFESINKNYEH